MFDSVKNVSLSCLYCAGVFARASETEVAEPAPSGGAEKDRSSAKEIQGSTRETTLYQSETCCPCHSGTKDLLYQQALLVLRIYRCDPKQTEYLTVLVI